jgi:hypothetical protein
MLLRVARGVGPYMQEVPCYRFIFDPPQMSINLNPFSRGYPHEGDPHIHTEGGDVLIVAETAVAYHQISAPAYGGMLEPEQ